MYCVFRKGYDTLFIIYKSSAAASFYFVRQMTKSDVLFLGLIFSFDTQGNLFGPRMQKSVVL